MTPSNRQESVLDALREALHAHYGARLSSTVLFGSRARGEATPDADYDILVVLKGDVDQQAERRVLRDIVYPLCLAHDAVVACHVVPVHRYRAERSPFMLNVRREGISV